jgi:hypothetical protein
MNAAQVEELILENRQITIQDLSAALELSIRTVLNIVHEELGYRTLGTKMSDGRAQKSTF